MNEDLKSLEQTPPSSEPANFSLFGAHGLWAVGVHVMRSINFASKAFIVSTLFALPITWLSWSYFSSQNANIAFSLKERDGVRYLKAAEPLLKTTLQLRATSSEASASLLGDINKAYKNLEQVQAELGPGLGTDQAYSELQKARSSAVDQSGDVLQRFVRNTAHIHALIELITAATDGSNLTLDPDIDSYYLMDATAFRLPDLMERVGLIRAAGAAALRDGKMSAVNRAGFQGGQLV